MKTLTDWFLLNFRWVFVLFLALPVCKLWETLNVVARRFKYTEIKQTKELHAHRVASVVEQVKGGDLDDEGTGKRKMCTGRAGHESMSLYEGSYKKTMHKIDLSQLNNILSVNTNIYDTCVRVEPGVTCGELSRKLLPLGWTLQVLPELEELTVGGLVMGFGIETSSHKYGLFQHTCIEFEVVLPSGEVAICNEKENVDLFRAIPWSHGTLAFLVSVKVRIVKARKYCKIEYQPFANDASMMAAFDEATRCPSNDFVECLVYERNESVLITGIMTDNEPVGAPLHRLGSFWAPWFYKHAQAFSHREGEDRRNKYYEYIPLRDYYHRHTKSLFWEMELILPFGNHPLFRYLLGWLMPPKVSILKRTTPARLQRMYETKHVVEDYLLPMERTSDFLALIRREAAIYPLWLCPYKNVKNSRGDFIDVGNSYDMYVDVGVYGVPKSIIDDANDETFVHLDFHEKMEAFLRDNEGYKGLYAKTHQTRQEFRAMFNHVKYDQMRLKYGSFGVFPTIYDKVRNESID